VAGPPCDFPASGGKEEEAMMDDAQLLRQFSHDHDEAAFAELVRRHVDMVYTASLRQMRGDPHRAREVTQMVFTDLSRKAAALVRHPLLPAWLHRSTRFSALRLLRAEARRQHYERQAGQESPGAAGGDPAPWERVRPVLDEAIDGLSERDRHAIMLRYFSNRAFGDVGRQLGLSENAARMRVQRALDKLRDVLERKGIKSSSGALAAALAGHAVSAAPTGVAVFAAQSAVAAAGASAGAWIAFMSTSKLPISLALAVLVCGAGAVTLQERAIRRADRELAVASGTSRDISALEGENQRLRTAAREAGAWKGEGSALPGLKDYEKALEARVALGSGHNRTAPGASKPAHLDGEGPPLDYAKLDLKPRAVMQVRPVYPPSMKDLGASGQVLVDFIVGPDGTVSNAYAVKTTVNDPEGGAVNLSPFVTATTTPGASVGDSTAGNSPASPKAPAESPVGTSDFDSAAIQAVSQWRFQPGQVNGHAVYTHMRVPIVFSLDASPAATAATWF
jgi:RNA polymerase sigma factor (sigma-70 family)